MERWAPSSSTRAHGRPLCASLRSRLSTPSLRVVIDHERARDTHQAAVGTIPAPSAHAMGSGGGGDVGRERRFTTEQAKKFIQNGVAAQLEGAGPLQEHHCCRCVYVHNYTTT